MTPETYTLPVGYTSGTDSPLTVTIDDPMTREINADPDEAAALRRSRAQYDEGDTGCVADGDSAADDIDD